LLGKKYFPCVYVKNATVTNNNLNYGYENDNIDVSRINIATSDLNFPLINVVNNFEYLECEKILEKILKEIEKESNDEFPYSLQYVEELKLNFWLKYFKNIYFANFLILITTIVSLH